MRRPVRRLWIALSCLLLVSAIAYDKSGRVRVMIGIDTEYVIGIAFAIFVFCIAHLDAANSPIGLRRLILRAGGMLSSISYSLYLCHFPILVLIAATFYPELPGRLSWRSGLSYTLVLVLLCLVAWAFWLLFERHTDRIRTWLGAQIDWLLRRKARQ